MLRSGAVVFTSYAPKGEHNDRVVRVKVHLSLCMFHLKKLLNASLILVRRLQELQHYPEDGGSMLLSNVGTLLPDYATSHPILE